MGIASGFIKNNKKDKEPIPYTCDNCGAKVNAIGRIPRCLGCGKQLCEICNNHMLCAADFNKLEKRDQKKVKRAGMGLENIKTSKRMFTIMPIVMASIAVILLILMVVLNDGMFYFLFGFLGGFLLLASTMFFCVFGNMEERETTRITRQIKDIIIPYEFKRFSTGPTKVKVHHCPNCGGNITEETEICEYCGSTLKETTEEKK
ncbi:MAG: hypothetical protein ACTSRE_08210 [Promethearchaeota archaeon]